MQSYLDNKSFANYSLPTMMSNYLYVNPHKGMLTDAKNRTAVLQAIDVDELVKQTYFGRGKTAEQIYPPNMMAAEFAKQSVTHDPSALTGTRRRACPPTRRPSPSATTRATRTTS